MLNKELSGLTTKQLRRAIRIREKIDALDRKLNSVLVSSGQNAHETPGEKPVSRRKRRMSAAGRARIATAMRARWREAKQAGRNTL